jgi:glycosyltransferase involved in cell wall biosynthesis
MLENKLCSPKKVTMIGNGTACGIDLSRFTRNEKIDNQASKLKKKYKLTPENLVIGFVGRLVPDKGIHILVESFLQLNELMENIRLFVIGAFEPHRGRLTAETVESLSTHPSIIHCNCTDEIETYYAVMDILVLPTLREGFPYTLLEAAAMSLAVIATKTTGCVDAVIDGQTGFLVPPNDVASLKDVMQILLGSPHLRRRMGQAARKHIEQNFASQYFLDAHVKLYRKMFTCS